MSITLEPIAFIRSPRATLDDDRWGAVQARIELADGVPAEALDGVDTFSHVEVFFHFHHVATDAVQFARHPRGNTAWPRVGIFAQRAKDRPNRLGATIARVVGRAGRVLEVIGLDAVDGTPVLDIKPVLREFLPREPVTQPQWAQELMSEYWA